jgi:cell division septation protein DedD
MPEPNARVAPREKFELSLDGRQVASVVVGALVVLAVVFGLGLTVGRQIGQRRAERSPAPGDLEALDRAPAPPKPLKDDALTFHDRLTKDAPPEPPPPPPAAIRPEPAQPKASPPPPAAIAAATPSPAAPAPQAAAPPAPSRPTSQAVPAPTPAARPASATSAKPWTVQLAAAQDRGEAERIRTRFAALHPRIEEADVPGRGRFYRVRVGGFDSRDAAEKYLRDVGRETGAKGYVTAAR